MKRWIMWVFLLVLGVSLCLIIFDVNMRQIRHKSIVSTLQSQTKTTLLNSYDTSYRTEETGVSLDFVKFENELLTNILENSVYKIDDENPSLNVKYLVIRDKQTVVVTKTSFEKNDALKAVSIVLNVKDAQYTMKMIVDENMK